MKLNFSWLYKLAYWWDDRKVEYVHRKYDRARLID